MTLRSLLDESAQLTMQLGKMSIDDPMYETVLAQRDKALRYLYKTWNDLKAQNIVSTMKFAIVQHANKISGNAIGFNVLAYRCKDGIFRMRPATDQIDWFDMPTAYLLAGEEYFIISSPF